MDDRAPLAEVSATPDGSVEPDGGSWSLPRGVIVLLGLAGAVVAVAGMRIAADMLAPAFLALMLTVAVSPLARRLLARGWPSWAAVLVTLLSTYLIVVGLMVSLAVSVAKLATLIPTYIEEGDDLLGDLSAALEDLGIGPEQIDAVTSKIDLGQVVSLLDSLLRGVLDGLSNSVFILALLLFMAMDSAHFPEKLGSAATARPAVIEALRGFATGTRRYLVVSTVFGLIVAAVDTVVLYLLDVPLPLLWGLLAFITNYIPNVGFVIGLVPPAILGLLEGGWDLMLLIILLYSVINFVIQSIIQPKFVGDSVGLSTTVTFLSLVFWAWVLGPLGALLAIPMTLLTKGLLVDIDPATRWMNTLLSSGGTPVPAAPAPAEPAPAEPAPGPAGPSPAASVAERGGRAGDTSG